MNDLYTTFIQISEKNKVLLINKVLSKKKHTLTYRGITFLKALIKEINWCCITQHVAITSTTVNDLVWSKYRVKQG